jgi:hypothetical protein
MAVREFVAITAAVEGDVDEAVVRSLIEHIQAKIRAVYGRTGKSHLQRRLSGYNQAARFSPWIVLVDLDHDAECAPPFPELMATRSISVHVLPRSGTRGRSMAHGRQKASCEISCCQHCKNSTEH